MSRKLGRIQPHFLPKLKFADYVEAGAPTPPSVYRPDRGFPWSVLANGPDNTVTNPIIRKFGVGNCVAARILHAIQHLAISANKEPPKITGDEGIKLYSDIGGFDPSQTTENGENPTDLGLDPNTADTYWKTTGVKLPDGTTDKIVGFLAVDPKKQAEWKRGIWEFDVLGCGLNLTQSAEESELWEVKANDPEIGGHEILLHSYDWRIGIDTWGLLWHMAVPYLEKQCDQLTVYLTEDIIKKGGISETGVNFDKLKTDFERYYS